MSTYPPVQATYSAPNVTASRFLESPDFVARRLRTLGELRYVGNVLLPGRASTMGGAVGYELTEGIFADRAPERVAPGGEYKLTTVADGPAGLAKVTKWGQDTLITDESIARRNMDPVNKAMTKLVNSAALAIDEAVVSAIASAVTGTTSATAEWTETDGSARILRDILTAVAAVRALNQGYEPDTVLIDDTVWASMASDDVIQTAMSRETDANAVYTGRFAQLAGLRVVHTNTANLPGGLGTKAWVFDSTQLGFIATENLGGGYLPAGGDGLVESKTMREDDNDAWKLRARATFVPVVTDPGAGRAITGVTS